MTDISAAPGDPHGGNDLKIKAGDTLIAHDWQAGNEFGVYIWIGSAMVVNNLRIQWPGGRQEPDPAVARKPTSGPIPEELLKL